MTMTTTTQLHEAIAATPGLSAALERFAEAEQCAATDRETLVAAEDAFELVAVGNDPAKRAEAAAALAGARVCVEASASPHLDGDGLIATRAALASGQRYVRDRIVYAPPSDDPRVPPSKLEPKTHDLTEAVMRAKIASEALRLSIDRWHIDPSKFNYVQTLALLAETSRLCETADAVRALALATLAVSTDERK
jgi:hypothetical protein